jgi:formamidopyrimidine-DNA glycosylase
MTIMAHMRMTGQMIVVGAGERFAAGHPDGNFVAEMPSKHTRVWFGFEDGSHLYFNDLRKFGFLALLDEKSLKNDRFLQELGPEPWDMSEADFYEALQRHKSAPIKATLLNQKVVAGLGNIYVDEACHLTRIFPGTLTGKLSRAQSDALLQNARKVMQDAIDAGGSTMKDYVRADGTRGNYLDKFARVFRRDGEACLTCGTTILKTRVAGRGTHYCPKCQPEQ